MKDYERDYDRERLEMISKHTALALEHAKLLRSDDPEAEKRMLEIRKKIAYLKAIEAAWPEYQEASESEEQQDEIQDEAITEEEQEQLLDNYAFKMPDWSDDFKALAKETSEFIKTLSLSCEQNDTLVHYVIENVIKANQEGFSYGFGVGAGRIDPRIVEVSKAGDHDA